MSYSLWPYLVEGELLRKTFGSGDADLLEKLEAEFASKFSCNAEWFKGEISEGAPTLREALRDLIAGEISRPKYAFQYGYALELLCKQFGQLLDNDCFQEYRSDWLRRVGRVEKLFDADPPLPIPKPFDFPGIGYMSIGAAKQELSRIDEMDLSDPDPDVSSARNQYRLWLELAVENDKDIVVFDY